MIQALFQSLNFSTGSSRATAPVHRPPTPPHIVNPPCSESPELKIIFLFFYAGMCCTLVPTFK